MTQSRGGLSYLARMRIGKDGKWQHDICVPVGAETVCACCVSGDGTLVAMSTREGSVIVFSTIQMEQLRNAQNCHGLPGTALCFTALGDTLVKYLKTIVTSSTNARLCANGVGID